ncbi:MAG TPA: inorganic phosphate transporter, partial [Flavobacteriales bacterium]|nr:inorganic phosphate transporter [Flavobacteriales bacterium]
MTLLIVIIALALIFDYINGFHDAANSIATIVSTKVLTPVQAVIWAAAFNFIAYFIFSDHHVANTVAKTVHEEFITLRVVLAGLIAAITWNLLTWWYGIPSSSSHTLIGGFAGAALAGAGFDLSSVNMSKIGLVAAFIFLAPLVGMLISIFITLVTLVPRLWLRLLIIAGATAITCIFILKNNDLRIGMALFSLVFMLTYAVDLTKAPSA